MLLNACSGVKGPGIWLAKSAGDQEFGGPEVQEARSAIRGQEFLSPAVQEDRSF